MRERQPLEDWLDGLTLQETRWVNEYLARKRLMPLLDLEGLELRRAVKSAARRHARKNQQLFERLDGAVRQKRHRTKVKKQRHVIDLSEDEFRALQALAAKAKTNRTEVIRRLIFQDAPQQTATRNRRSQRDLTLKGRDMAKRAETAKRMADLYAQELALARAMMTTREIKWDIPKESELVLGRFYYDVLKAQMEKTFAEEKAKLRKQLHNIDRSIPRPEQAKRPAKKNEHQNRAESDNEAR